MKRFSSYNAVAGVLFFWALATSTPGLAVDYYVSPRGNDSNSGTAARPWLSVSRVNATAFAPGDRILFEGGQTLEGNLVLDERSKSDPHNPITIGSYGHGRATIQAGVGTGVVVRNFGGAVVRDLIVRGDGASTNQGFGVLALNERGTAKLQLIRIENVEASGFRWAGIYVGGVPTLLPGFKALSGSRYGFRNVQILSSTAHDNMYCGILVSGPWNKAAGGYANEDVTIQDCLAYDNRGDPEYLKHHSGDGILMDDTDGGLIERCVSHHNGGANGSRKSGPVGIWADSSNRITIQYCEAYANRTGGGKDGGGFDLDGGVSNSVVQYNFSHGNDGPGFLVWNYAYSAHPLSNNLIRYNLSENDGRSHHCGGLEIGTSGEAVQHIEVYNNTVWITKNGSVAPSAIWVVGSNNNQDLHFRNNLLITDGEVPLIEVEKNQTGAVFQGNAYWAQAGAFLVSYAETKYESLATWRTQTGQETLDGKAVGIFGDPRLTQVGVGEDHSGPRPLSSLQNYHLLPGSPLIDAGLDLRACFGLDIGNQDLRGTPIPQGQAYDIGAFEAPAPGRLSPSTSLENEFRDPGNVQQGSAAARVPGGSLPLYGD